MQKKCVIDSRLYKKCEKGKSVPHPTIIKRAVRKLKPKARESSKSAYNDTIIIDNSRIFLVYYYESDSIYVIEARYTKYK